MKCFVKSTFSWSHYFVKKMLLKNMNSVITLITFSYICVFHSSTFSTSSAMQFGVKSFGTLAKVSFCLFLAEHVWHQILFQWPFGLNVNSV
jgi:hypothetical protein